MNTDTKYNDIKTHLMNYYNIYYIDEFDQIYNKL